MAIEFPVFLSLVEEGFQRLHRTVLHLKEGILACLLDIGLEHLLDELRIDIHTKFAFLIVDDHLLGSPFHHPLFEVEVVLLLGYSTSSTGSITASVGEEQYRQHHDDDDVYPVHVEPRGIGIFLFILFHGLYSFSE